MPADPAAAPGAALPLAWVNELADRAGGLGAWLEARLATLLASGVRGCRAYSSVAEIIGTWLARLGGFLAHVVLRPEANGCRSRAAVSCCYPARLGAGQLLGRKL